MKLNVALDEVMLSDSFKKFMFALIVVGAILFAFSEKNCSNCTKPKGTKKIWLY